MDKSDVNDLISSRSSGFGLLDIVVIVKDKKERKKNKGATAKKGKVEGKKTSSSDLGRTCIIHKYHVCSVG